MSGVRLFWNCLFSPKLYKVYTGRSTEGRYEESNLERWGDQIISTIFLMWNLGLYTSPVLVFMMYRKGYFMYDGAVTFAKFTLGFGCALLFSYCLRSYGRLSNSTYVEFHKALSAATENLNPATKKTLSRYDFEFSAWPVEFSWKDLGDKSKRGTTDPVPRRSFSSTLFYAPYATVSYLVAHTFGIRLIYPGSVSIVSYMMSSILMKGRSKLLENDEGERYKLLTSDQNEIDTVFVDRRGKSKNGSVLVICSEGNAGFYEIGIMSTPMEANYSVLGWNHPGFGGSTGMPYPEQEKNAMDIVIQFAIIRLGFQPENIVMFGWSIGGFTASWAAKMYPDVRAVILDATFDDLLPLAIPRMPLTLEPLVKQTIRYHCNLEVAEQVCQYPGPVLLIRRAEDEVICLQPGDISTNRANPLLTQMLRHRYPLLVTPETEIVLEKWLSNTGSKQINIMTEYGVNETSCRAELAAYYASNDKTFPTSIGGGLDKPRKIQLLLYLASEYMKDYNSSHCTQLPASMFVIPESLT
ncbi:phosphatidylserine lipase ABHD16A [Lycorma delicatula]|uniref:phosphatidylserine lipase ABHD16A n=1 Tax=Lycorma delicatula TaxID=130591 RepID=UPI003F50EEED